MQNGKLDLDQPLSRYLAEIETDWSDKVTVRQLLTHRSGLPRAWQDYADQPDDYPFKTNEIVAVINRLSLDFEPGTSKAYSNTGYFLLARVIAAVSGDSWEEALHAGIFTPLKMNDTGIYRFGVPIASRAHGYENHLVGRPVVGTTGHKNQIYGPGGLFSTTEDLYKLDRAFYGNQLLSDASKALMFAEGTTEPGLGWNVIRGNPFRLALQSGNDGEGFMSLLVRLPDSGHTVVYLTNNAILGRRHYMDLPNLMISALLEKVPAEVPEPVALNLLNTLLDQGGKAAWSYYQTLEKPEFHKRWVGPRHATGNPDASPGESSRSWTSLADKAEPDLFTVPVQADLVAWTRRYHDLGYCREARLLQEFVTNHWAAPLPPPVLD
jgi:CubicO group peptidase (beta-lactamase class C family)